MKKNKQMPNTWITALKEWNRGKQNWCIPRKTSSDYSQVKDIMERNRTPAAARREAERAHGASRAVSNMLSEVVRRTTRDVRPTYRQQTLTGQTPSTRQARRPPRVLPRTDQGQRRITEMMRNRR